MKAVALLEVSHTPAPPHARLSVMAAEAVAVKEEKKKERVGPSPLVRPG